jgi:hypothetical protein
MSSLGPTGGTAAAPAAGRAVPGSVNRLERSGLDVEVDRSSKLLGEFYDLYRESLWRKAAELREPPWLTRLRMSRISPHGRTSCPR